MSVKSQFLKKLQARQCDPVPRMSKSQADIEEFRLRMSQLQEQMNVWLAETGLNVEALTAFVTDLLVEDGVFDISALVLRYDNQVVKFLPIFLYGQGVTGCVEVTFNTGGQVTSLGRLSMRSGNSSDWTFTPSAALSRPGQTFDESTFFGLILALLP